MNIGKLFIELLLSAGIQPDDAALTAITTSDIEIPDDVAKSLRNSLMNEDSAKNNPVLKRHFTAQALNTVDAELNDVISSYDGFTADDIANFKAEKSSYKRMKIVTERIREIESGKSGGDADERVKKWKSEFERANEMLVNAKSERETAIAQAKSDAENSLMSFAFDAELNGKKYVNDGLDQSVNRMVAKQLIEQRLKSDGAKIIRHDGTMKLVRHDDSEMDFMVENKKVNFGDYVDRVLTDHKMLKVNDGGGNGDDDQKRQMTNKGQSGNTPAEVIDDYQRQIDRMTGVVA